MADPISLILLGAMVLGPTGFLAGEYLHDKKEREESEDRDSDSGS